MSLPKQNILSLAQTTKIAIFDHHLGDEIQEVFHHNPVIKGENPDTYPSASWIINRYIGKEPNLFAFLGVVGDHENKIRDNPQFMGLLTKFCHQKRIEFQDLLAMVHLLDSNYKVGDKTEVEKAPLYLLTHDDPQDILHNEKWQKNLSNLTEEIEKQLHEPPEELDGFLVKKMHTPYNIISTVTRQIAWKTGKTTIVLNTGFFTKFDQVYVRSTVNLKPLILTGKNLGLKCGGKQEVFGAIVPKAQTENLMITIIDFLKKNRVKY